MVDIRPFQSEDASLWDDFVLASRNGTFFHTRKFLSYHPSGRFTDVSLLCIKGGEVVALFPAAQQEVEGKSMLVSHPGASYGGLVLSRMEGAKTTGEVVASIRAYAQEHGFAGISFLRLTPQSVRREWSDDQEYWIFYNGGSLVRLEMDGSIYLRHMTEETVLDHVSGKCRNMVRQAERSGVTVQWGEDTASFWPLLESTLSVRHGAKPTHTLEEFLHLRSIAPNDVRLCTAFYNGQMIAGVVIVTLHPRALYTLYMAQDYAYQKLHPIHLILKEVLTTGIREGRSVLHVGVSTENGGRVLNDGLVFFKESFGTRPVRRESWEIRFN